MERDLSISTKVRVERRDEGIRSIEALRLVIGDCLALSLLNSVHPMEICVQGSCL
jgi:hypothetical protein